MPLIEELPISQSHRVTHGWAYVPDTGPQPIAAIQPGSRKRARDTTTIHAAATAKQQKALQSRLDSLDKENYRDGVSIPIPPRAERKRDRKMTPNVRRILTYQRGFAHYLADEEAAAAAAGVIGSSTTQAPSGKRKVGVNATTNTTSTNITTSEPTPTTPAPTTPAAAVPTPAPPRRGRPPGSKAKAKAKIKETENQEPPAPPSTSTIKREQNPTTEEVNQDNEDSDTPMPDLPPPLPPVPKPSNSHSRPRTPPLLRTLNVPKMPSARVMNILTSEPPLSWVGARAQFAADDEVKPARRFCGVCGYWGRVKCRGCGEWTCGLGECWRGHQGGCVAALYQ